jgi:hypothetical protein
MPADELKSPKVGIAIFEYQLRGKSTYAFCPIIKGQGSRVSSGLYG